MITEVVYYQVKCDYPNCDHNTQTHDFEHSAYSDSDSAETVAELSEWTCVGIRHYCPCHYIAECEKCDIRSPEVKERESGSELCDRCALKEAS